MIFLWLKDSIAVVYTWTDLIETEVGRLINIYFLIVEVSTIKKCEAGIIQFLFLFMILSDVVCKMFNSV